MSQGAIPIAGALESQLLPYLWLRPKLDDDLQWETLTNSGIPLLPPAFTASPSPRWRRARSSVPICNGIRVVLTFPLHVSIAFNFPRLTAVAPDRDTLTLTG